MHSLEKLLETYDYTLPEELIAQNPATPRDSSRLLVYERKNKEIFWDNFKNLTNYLPKNSVLIFNKTKVLPARLTITKPTGGLAKILYIKNDKNLIIFLSNKQLKIGAIINLNKKIFFEVKRKIGKKYLLKPSFNIKDIFKILEKYGDSPLPPYIKKTSLTKRDLKKRYQTVFAEKLGSVAVPTASLHFTKNLLNKIKKAGHDIKFITLHVNLGTFAPLTEENIRTGLLHEEYYEIDKKTAEFINKAKKEKRPIIAVGTTSARTLESATKSNKLTNLRAGTKLFIRNNYKFKTVDGLITNFHVPQSSLLMLVASFTSRDKILDLYKRAIKKRFRFFSFGDGMLIL